MSGVVRKIISVATAAKPVGPYNQAVVAGNTMYISGQIGLDKDGLMAKGGVSEQAVQVFENMKAILAGANCEMGNVVKTTILLQDIDDWPKVNDVYVKYFTEKYPARAAYAVSGLPKGALVEVEAVAIVGDIKDE